MNANRKSHVLYWKWRFGEWNARSCSRIHTFLCLYSFVWLREHNNILMTISNISSHHFVDRFYPIEDNTSLRLLLNSNFRNVLVRINRSFVAMIKQNHNDCIWLLIKNSTSTSRRTWWWFWFHRIVIHALKWRRTSNHYTTTLKKPRMLDSIRRRIVPPMLAQENK